MPKKAPIDKELATKIKAAMKKKMHFVAVVKSPKEGALFVSKAKVDKESVTGAKETLGGGKTFKGTVHGENGTLVFSVNKEPPATLGPVIARYAKTYAGVKIKAVARFDQQLANEVDLGGKSKESLHRREMTKAINDAMSGQDEDIHRKRKIGPTTKDKDYEKNVTAPANKVLLKASEELMTGTQLTPETVRELQSVLVMLANAKKAYGDKITGSSEKDQQRQKKKLAIAKREEAINKILSKAGAGTSLTDSEGSEEETSEEEAKVIAKELKSLSDNIAQNGTKFAVWQKKSLQESLKKIRTLRESGSFKEAKEELDTAREILSGKGQKNNPYVTVLNEDDEVDVKEARKRGYGVPKSLGEKESKEEESSEGLKHGYSTPIKGLKGGDDSTISEDEKSEDESSDPLRNKIKEKGKEGYEPDDELDLVPENQDISFSDDEKSKQEEEEEENPFGDERLKADDSKEDVEEDGPKQKVEEEQESEEEVPEVKLKAPAPKIRTAGEQWKKAAKVISQQVNSLQSAVLKVNDSRAAGIARGLNRIVSGVPSLGGILEEIASAKETSDNKALAELLPTAKRMADSAEKLANSLLVTSVDGNPFVKLQLQKVLTETVKAVRQVLQ